MIVIAGIPSEPPLRMAIDAARAAGIDHVVVNQRRAAGMDIELEIGDHGVRGELTVDDRSVDLGDVDGIYWRLMEPARLPENGPTARPADRTRSLGFHAVLDVWIDTAPCRVANRLDAMGSNASKPYQALLIERVGFRTPPTLVSSVPADVRTTAATWGPMIFKSTSSVRSIVRPFDDSDADALDRIRWLPTQFQAVVPGDDIRVHVVDRAVLATRVHSDATDYRYAGRDGLDTGLVPIELDGDVSEACRLLAAELELPFCGIDLRLTPDGDWYCFEVNPSPGYSYYEGETGQPISDTLVRWLDTGRS